MNMSEYLVTERKGFGEILRLGGMILKVRETQEYWITVLLRLVRIFLLAVIVWRNYTPANKLD